MPGQGVSQRCPRNANKRSARSQPACTGTTNANLAWGDDANGGCCTLKRGSGIFILVLSIISLVGSIICAVIAGFSEMGLYTAFNWIHFVLLIYASRPLRPTCAAARRQQIMGGAHRGY